MLEGAGPAQRVSPEPQVPLAALTPLTVPLPRTLSLEFVELPEVLHSATYRDAGAEDVCFLTVAQYLPAQVRRKVTDGEGPA